MKKDGDLVPQKRVAEEMCVSLSTLWRARMSGIQGFPAPVIKRNLVHWRKKDMRKLEDALERFKGRVAFEREREAARKLAALQRTKGALEAKRKPRLNKSQWQSDLFD